MFLQELGRLHQIAGNPESARTFYGEALELYREQEITPVIDASDVSYGASIFANDRVIPYTGSDYERLYTHLLQAQNYLLLDQPQAALVELRAAANYRRFVADKRAGRVEKAEEQRVYAALSDTPLGGGGLAGDDRNRFLNAYATFASGALREALGERNEALIHYRQALTLAPQSRYIAGALTRLARQYDPALARDTAERFDLDLEAYDPRQPHLILLVESGFAPAKSELEIQYFDTLRGQFFAIALPFYGQAQDLSGIYHSVQLDGKPLQPPELTSRTSLLAENDLREAYPGIVLRQVARLVAKDIATNATLDALNRQDDAAGLAVGLAALGGVVAMQAASTQADTRSWLSLPARADVLDIGLTPGQHRLTVTSTYGSGRTETLEFEAPPRGVVVVRLIDTGRFMRLDRLY